MCYDKRFKDGTGGFRINYEPRFFMSWGILNLMIGEESSGVITSVIKGLEGFYGCYREIDFSPYSLNFLIKCFNRNLKLCLMFNPYWVGS